jgi:MYXO-CTERM domain-containing protein
VTILRRRLWAAPATVALVLALLAAFAPASEASPIIVSFDTTRGGIDGFADNPIQASARALIQSNFPGATFTGSPVLTSSFLQGADLVFVGTAFSTSTAITPLSASEQSALLSFVLGGGGAILAVDNTNQSVSPPASVTDNSLVNPFGVIADGDLFPSAAQNPVTGTFVNSANPIANGPFGSPTSFLMRRPGYFSSLGLNAEPVIVDPFGNPVLAIIYPGSLGPNSGPVVFDADLDVLDPSVAANNLPTVLNAFAFALPTPEPSSGLLAVLGFAGLAAYRRRWKA